MTAARSARATPPGSEASVKRTDHRDPVGPRIADCSDVRRRDAADREERDGRVRRRVADELEPDRRSPGLGRGRVDRADADVVDRDVRRGIDLLGAVCGQPDQPFRSDGGAGVGDGGVVLPDVDAVGVHGRHQVGAVVEDEQRAVLGGRRREPPPRGHNRVVGGLLHPQLHDVDAGAKRAGEEVVGRVGAHQIQVRGSQAFAAIGHGSQVWQGVEYMRSYPHCPCLAHERSLTCTSDCRAAKMTLTAQKSAQTTEKLVKRGFRAIERPSSRI